VNSFDLLAVVASALGATWVVLGVWLLGERSLYDRGRARAELDTEALATRSVEARALSRRRLRRVALGPRSDAMVVAAWELVRRDGPRLRATAAAGPRAARLRALAILARARDASAVGLLRTMTKTAGADSTTGLLRLVAELPAVEADEVLLEVLVDGRLSRSRTATELEPRTPRLRRELIALTRSPNAELRYWAVTLLRREMGHRPAVDAVRARVADDSPNVRAAVAEALGFAPSELVRPLLQELLTDEAFFVRSHAARAVAQSGDELLANALLPLLADHSWWVRAAAKESLGALGESGIEVAMAALSHSDPFARDSALEIIAASDRQLDESDLRQVIAVAEVA
jgi:HEAT repeat protein